MGVTCVSETEYFFHFSEYDPKYKKSTEDPASPVRPASSTTKRGREPRSQGQVQKQECLYEIFQKMIFT